MTNPLLNLYSAFFQKYGVALRAQARFQMNVIVEKNDTFNWFKDIQDDVVYLPIMWLDEGISGPSKVRFILWLPISKNSNCLKISYGFLYFFPDYER